MNIKVPLDLITLIVLVIVTICSLYEAWEIFINKKRVVIWPFAGLIFFIKVFWGFKTAAKRKEVIIQTLGLKMMGLYALIGGILYVILTIFFFYAFILK